MSTTSMTTDALRTTLIETGLLVPTSVSGVYARGSGFERVRLAVDAAVTQAAAAESPELLAFPPILPRDQFETSGYLSGFPHLAGSVFSFDGDERAAQAQYDAASRHEDWSSYQSMTDVVLTPAACYPLYPAVAARGPLPEGGVVLDTGDAYVFRREPSADPARMQIFHMREIVRIGSREEVGAWRIAWRGRAQELLESFGLDIELELAHDPFFGRAGRLLASAQRQAELKWEMLAPVSGETRTAIASSNFHETHFGDTYGLRTASGEPACTACTAFGEERITLALFAAHGMDSRDWPAAVRAALAL
jgi:seryl-tRNA synthetase